MAWHEAVTSRTVQRGRLGGEAVGELVENGRLADAALEKTIEQVPLSVKPTWAALRGCGVPARASSDSF